MLTGKANLKLFLLKCSILRTLTYPVYTYLLRYNWNKYCHWPETGESFKPPGPMLIIQTRTSISAAPSREAHYQAMTLPVLPPTAPCHPSLHWIPRLSLSPFQSSALFYTIDPRYSSYLLYYSNLSYSSENPPQATATHFCIVILSIYWVEEDSKNRNLMYLCSKKLQA